MTLTFASPALGRFKPVLVGAISLAITGVVGFVGSSPAVARDPGPLAPWEKPTLAKIATKAPPPTSVYVANGGSDTNPGTLALPFATIHHALAVVAAGGTVVVRGGTYRESLGPIKHKVTLEAYPDAQPWVKGSVQVAPSTFTASGGAWSMPFTTPMCDTCYPGGALDPLYPTAGYPEQVFVDGAPLRQRLASTATTTWSRTRSSSTRHERHRGEKGVGPRYRPHRDCLLQLGALEHRTVAVRVDR